jgi:hypothetical protein
MSDNTAVNRRRWRRRSLPFVRSAVLEVDERPHIVALTDIGLEGAFLSARVAIEPTSRMLLRLVIPGTSTEVELPCQLVWKTGDPDAARERPAGIAVRFKELPDAVKRRVASFARERLGPAPQPAPTERYEYRVAERTELRIDELNRLGLDGWLLTTTLPTKDGFLLVFARRL